MTSSPPGAGDEAQPLVLIVDDDERNLKLARDVLRASGLRTLGATSGREAISLAVCHLPDVILMDLRLPDMGGAEAVRRLAETDVTAQIPVVALSSLPPGGDWFAAAGFAGYLEKPFDIRSFPDRVRGYCVGAETRRVTPAGRSVPGRCASTVPGTPAARVGAAARDSYRLPHAR